MTKPFLARRMRRAALVLVLALAALLALRTALGAAPAPRLALGTDVHDAVRAVARDQALGAVAGEPSIRTAHFIIKYPAGDGADAAIVASQVERAYAFVFSRMGGRPADPVVVRVETRAALAADLSVPPEQDPLGAYWRGVIWLLTPSAYLPGSAAQRQAAFATVGPVAHELTHLADDDITGGRMPAFLDEGMAQYIQWRFSGYLWLQASNTFCQPHYSWSQLVSDFDSLPNQALAYRESFAVVRAVEDASPHAAARMMAAISTGATPSQAVRDAVGARDAAALAAGSAWTCGSGRPAHAAAAPAAGGTVTSAAKPAKAFGREPL
jgi:hypothetical protein